MREGRELQEEMSGTGKPITSDSGGFQKKEVSVERCRLQQGCTES